MCLSFFYRLLLCCFFRFNFTLFFSGFSASRFSLVFRLSFIFFSFVFLCITVHLLPCFIYFFTSCLSLFFYFFLFILLFILCISLHSIPVTYSFFIPPCTSLYSNNLIFSLPFLSTCTHYYPLSSSPLRSPFLSNSFTSLLPILSPTRRAPTRGENHNLCLSRDAPGLEPR